MPASVHNIDFFLASIRLFYECMCEKKLISKEQLKEFNEDIKNCKDEFFEFCAALHSDEADPEFMFQDYQNFPSSLYSECMNREDLEKIISLYSDYSDDERDAIFEYWDEHDASADAQSIIDNLVYSGDFDDYAYEMADELIGDNDSVLARYFDYSAFARDLAFDYVVTSNFVFAA